MRRRPRSALSILGLLLAISIGASVSGAIGDEPLEPSEGAPPGVQHARIPGPVTDLVWSQVGQEIGDGAERVAIVVWHEPTGYPPDGGLYGRMYDQERRINLIDRYAADVAAAGFKVVIFKFHGMAEDPDDLAAADLRWRLRQLWEDEENGSLAGAVLIGNVPYLLFERQIPYDHDDDPETPPLYIVRDYASDVLLGDMDAEVRDDLENGDWRDRVLDTVDTSACGNEEIEIWTSRIMVRPEVAAYYNSSEKALLTAYFDRNHSDRWSAFNNSGTSLLFGQRSCHSEGIPLHQSLFGTGESDVKHICPLSEQPPPPTGSGAYLYWLSLGYSSVFLGPTHGDVLHQFTSGVSRDDYRDAHPQTMSFIFFSCRNADFALPLASIAEVAGFNPLPAQGGPLVVLAPTDFIGGGAIESDEYYDVLPEGRCLGEGLKEIVNRRHAVDWISWVLLGDATLKRWGETVTWIGEDSEWTDPDNWSIGQPPFPADNVLHDNQYVIQMNTGSDENPNRIKGFEGGGLLGGGLSILSAKEMVIGGNAEFHDDYAVTLLEGPPPPHNPPTKLRCEGDCRGGAFTLSDNTSLEVGGVLDRCSVEICGADALVQASGGITGGVGSGQNWTINLGTVEAGGTSALCGDWSLNGGHAHFERMSACEGDRIQILLENGASVQVEQLPAELDGLTLVTSPFPGSQTRELSYGPGNNCFDGGREDGEYTDWLYFGSGTRISDPSGHGTLHLDVRGELRIASDFEVPSVSSGWDSRGVNITLQPIWATESFSDPLVPGEPEVVEQAVELISPVLTGEPVAFLDVPCNGPFQDLDIADWNPASPEDEPPLPVAMRNYYDNEPGSFSTETAYFRNIHIGANRRVDFFSDHGFIHYWGTFDMEDGANVYIDGVAQNVAGPAITGVVGTLSGDWNGDCSIGNIELAQLQAAIQGGASTYNQLMDIDCDGQLTVQVELAQVLANAVVQPSCTPPRAARSAERGGEPSIESWRESFEPEPLERYEDVPGLATWLRETLPEEQLEEFIIELDDAAARFAEEPIGEDMIELLYYLR